MSEIKESMGIELELLASPDKKQGDSRNFGNISNAIFSSSYRPETNRIFKYSLYFLKKPIVFTWFIHAACVGLDYKKEKIPVVLDADLFVTQVSYPSTIIFAWTKLFPSKFCNLPCRRMWFFLFTGCWVCLEVWPSVPVLQLLLDSSMVW